MGHSREQPGTPSKRTALVRDPSTVLSYGALGAYAFWLYAFGPAVALLRTELGFSYAVVGIYSAVWSGGATFASAVFARAAARVGLWSMLWTSATVTALGAAVFVLTRDVVWTLAGALVMGTAGTATQLTTQSVLSERHGTRRGQALVEANVGAGACAVVAPLALGGLASTVAGWRTAMWLPVLVFAGLFLAYRHHPHGRPRGTASSREAPDRPRPDGHPPRLSTACRILCVLVGVGIAVEFCVIYFGAELLAARTSLSPTAAVTTMTAFYAGMLVGRVAGARVVSTPARSVAILWGSVALTVVGLVVSVIATDAALGAAAVMLAGIGVANLFPLSLSLALDAAGSRADAANGLAQVIGGILVIVAPFALGALADEVGLTGAFTVAPALALACGGLLAVSVHATRWPSPGDRTPDR